jgi:hypothetical protein
MESTRQAKKPVQASLPDTVSLDASLPDLLKGASWIWSQTSARGQSVRQFRKIVRSHVLPRSVSLAIFAEARFHVWVNDHYISRGPAFHHPSRRPVQIHDLAPYWQAGDNVIAVLVFDPDVSQQTGTPTGMPGLIARIDLVDDQTGDTILHPSDASWSVNDATGYLSNVPRRGWALGYIDVIDASLAPHDWQEVDYSAAHWAPATVRNTDVSFSHQWLVQPLPLLRTRVEPVKHLLSHYAVHALPPVIRADDLPPEFGDKLSNEPWVAPDGLVVSTSDVPGTLTITGLAPQRGAALVFDLGSEFTGQVCFECTCPTSGTIDVGWSELMINGRPPVMRKRVSYADRLIAVAGENRWEPLSFSAGRYLVLVLREFDGPVQIRNLGMRVSEPDLDFRGHFESSDPVLNRIAELCVNCIRVGTQEGLMDCPTREQAPYLGDGNLIGKWLGMITGDYRHWKYLLQESFARQSPDGLLRDAIFSGHRRSILDYNLLAVIGARDYLQLTGDMETVQAVLPACRKVFRWFDSRCNSAGLIDTTHHRFIPEGDWDHTYDPATDAREWATILFIDHPGLGWHNVGEPEIDRRGVNTAINAVYLVAREALAELEHAVRGSASAIAPQAMKSSLRAFAYDPDHKVFADGSLNGKRLQQVSQQTNIWCLWADLLDEQKSQAVLDAILSDRDPNLARCGPYFFAYALPQMARLNRHSEALDLIRRLWKPMVDSDATTLWETFSGDDLDSRCHPWSAAPIEFLLCEVLGLKSLLDASTPDVLVPRVDLLDHAKGTLMTSRGAVSISWTRFNGKLQLSGELPAGVTAMLRTASGQTQVTGQWAWQE